MARYTHWKATVALSILLNLALIINVFAQSTSPNANITYSCRAERLGSVFEYLSEHSGYDFIYSRDLVDVSQRVSIVVNNKPVSEVLALIEKQAGVLFRIQDHHVIVKSAPKIQPSAPAKIITAPAVLETPDSLLITSISRTIPVMPVESHADLLQRHLDKRIREVQQLLGPGVPRSISPFDITQINFNNRYKGWFASIGTYVGDAHSGVELRAGLPFLYAVFNPHVKPGQGFYGSYGVGNSIDITGNFSLNTIYLYSNRTTTQTNYPFGVTGPEVRRSENIRLHQIKLAMQYAFSKNISLRAGPVLNYRTTLNETTVRQSLSQESYPYGYSYTVPAQNNQVFFLTRSARLFESWVGWEASIQYRINFFDK